MTNGNEAGTVDDLIDDAKRAGFPATQRMIMDWQSIGLLDYPTAQGGRGRGHGSNKKLYSANQRQLFLTLLAKRSQTSRVVNLTAIPVYLWTYWGDEYVPLQQMRKALRFYIDKALKPSLNGRRQTAAQITAQLRHPQASQTRVNKLERLLVKAMHEGAGLNDAIETEMQAVFDPFDEGRVVGPPGVRLSVDRVMRIAISVEFAVSVLSRDDQGVSDELFRAARELLRASMTAYLNEQPDLALHAGELTREFAPVTAQTQVNSCRNDLLLNVGLLMTETPLP
jgi:hypothetical protein